MVKDYKDISFYNFSYNEKATKTLQHDRLGVARHLSFTLRYGNLVKCLPKGSKIEVQQVNCGLLLTVFLMLNCEHQFLLSY